MRVINVPQNTVPVRYEDQQPAVTKDENYFWFTLKAVLRAALARMSGVDLLGVSELYKEITNQVGRPELRIERECDWEKLKTWVENHRGWPGDPEDAVSMLGAVRNAEKQKAGKRA